MTQNESIALPAAHLAIAYTDDKHIRQGALAGMSHADNVVMFTNTGPASCRFHGYPGVAALNAAGKQILQAAPVPRGRIPLVILAPARSRPVFGHKRRNLGALQSP